MIEIEDMDQEQVEYELAGEKVLGLRDTIRVRGFDPMSKPHDPGVMYLRQLRDLIDAYINEGRMRKADG